MVSADASTLNGRHELAVYLCFGLISHCDFFKMCSFLSLKLNMF